MNVAKLSQPSTKSDVPGQCIPAYRTTRNTSHHDGGRGNRAKFNSVEKEVNLAKPPQPSTKSDVPVQCIPAYRTTRNTPHLDGEDTPNVSLASWKRLHVVTHEVIVQYLVSDWTAMRATPLPSKTCLLRNAPSWTRLEFWPFMVGETSNVRP